MAFEIGKAYWFYYEYGKTEDDDNRSTRVTSSIQWFHDANQYGTPGTNEYDMASTYEQIGVFHRDITISMYEASDTGMYIVYFNNLSNLLNGINDEQSEMLKLEVYSLCMNALETYAYKIASDGVEKEREENMLNTIISTVTDMNTSSDRTDVMKKEILEREEFVKEAIEKAY